MQLKMHCLRKLLISDIDRVAAAKRTPGWRRTGQIPRPSGWCSSALRWQLVKSPEPKHRAHFMTRHRVPKLHVRVYVCFSPTKKNSIRPEVYLGSILYQ